MKVLTIQELLLLNQYVQGVISREDISKWFLSLDEEDKQATVKNVWVLALQAQIRENDIEDATAAAGLKPTHVPVVMISKKNTAFRNNGYTLSTLKGAVLCQAFWLVLECFALAERRRKESEGLLECNHWWHQDLSDKRIVQKILDEFHL